MTQVHSNENNKNQVETSKLSNGDVALVSEKEQRCMRRKCLLYCELNSEEKTKITIHTTDLEKGKTNQHYFEDEIKKLTGAKDYELGLNILFKGVFAMPGTDRTENTNVALQTLSDSMPKDVTEARLCMLEAALYAQGMQCFNRAERENMIPQREYYIKNAIKLLRLHNETIETLNKYRRGGEQRVVVQHVQVNDGGKAVVGGVFEGGGLQEKSSGVGHGHSSDL